MIYSLFIIAIMIVILLNIKKIFAHLKKHSDLYKKIYVLVIFIGSFGGLLLNTSLDNCFGNFSHSIFYILNGLTIGLLIIPEIDNRIFRLVIFSFKGVFFIFSLYFFAVFLPLIPIGLFGILLAGLGLLIFVPLGLILLHIKSLKVDFDYLKLHYNKGIICLCFIVGISIIPTSLFIIMNRDRVNINTALAFVYTRNFEDNSNINIDLNGVERSLNNIKHNKSNNRSMFDTITTEIPYISSMYNNYVLDGLSLSNERIRYIEKVLLGKTMVDTSTINSSMEDKRVFIKDINTNTIYDKEKKVYTTWIDIELENYNYINQAEYSTTFKIPEGTYISDYYLNVLGEKKYGMIADKRAANWIYRQVTKVQMRDPGILTYLDNNTIEFKVFPFAAKEVRKTGIELVHQRPINIAIDEFKLSLNTEDNNVAYKKPSIHDFSNSIYVPLEVKNTLQKIERNPKYHFIIDYSSGNKKLISNYIKRIKDYIDINEIATETVEIVGLNYKETSIEYSPDFEKSLKKVKIEGGLNLDFTVKRIFKENYLNNSSYYPVIIVATDDISKGVISKELDFLKFLAPEGMYCYKLREELVLNKYSLCNLKKKEKTLKTVEPTNVLSLKHNNKNYYLSDNNEASIITLDVDTYVNDDLESKWHIASGLKGYYMKSLLSPKTKINDALEITKNSISNEVMTPLTSFIVLETKEQEDSMLEKQKEILETTKPLDIADVTEMSEPMIILVLIVFVGVLVIWKKRKSIKFYK